MEKSKQVEILEINQFSLESTGFYINKLSAHLQSSHLHINKPHKHNFFASILFTHGNGKHEIDFNSYEVKPSAVFFLSPGQTHNWNLSDDVEGIIFFHSQEFYEAHYIRDFLSDYALFSSLQKQSVLYLDQPMSSEIFVYLKNYTLCIFLSTLRRSSCY